MKRVSGGCPPMASRVLRRTSVRAARALIRQQVLFDNGGAGGTSARLIGHTALQGMACLTDT
jgi:hypothetical protein